MDTTASPIEIARCVQRLDRDQCIRRLESFEAIPLDFSREMLEGMSVERLRHLLLAAMITAARHGRPGQ